MTNIKRKIAVMLRSPKFRWLNSTAQLINFAAFHWDERMRMTHPGKEDPDRTYYVIHPRDTTEGLLSSYYYVLSQVKWAVSRGYLAYVDFQDTRCQYYVNREINGSKNAWEYYFTQPSPVSPDEINRKRNVLQSGWSMKNSIPGFGKTLEDARLPENLNLTTQVLRVQPYIDGMIDRIVEKDFAGRQVLGVFIRGTDYIALKPKGHPIQPSIDQVLEKTDEFVAAYHPDRIFVVTEDKNYYDMFVERYGEKVFTSDDEFVSGYNTSGFISNAFRSDPYERGLKYLIRILLLTRCDYLVSSITNGSLFAYGMKTGEYKDDFWFDLGKYE